MPQWTPWRKREVQVQLIIIKVLLHWLLDKWKLQSINMKVKHLWVPFWGCFIITEIENERKITYCPCCCWPDPSWVDRATCSGLQGPFGSICSQHPCYGGSSPIWGVGLRMWEGFQLCPMVTGLWNSAASCLIPRPPMVLLLCEELGKGHQEFQAWCHQYADDIQFYLPFPPTSEDAVDCLYWCLESVMGWMKVHKMEINPDKSEVLWISRKAVQGLQIYPVL